MTQTRFRPLFLSVAGLAALLTCLNAYGQAQPDQRWYQIEVTLFAYDNAMQAQEHWPMELLQQPLARSTRPLDRLTDVLTLPEWLDVTLTTPASTSSSDIVRTDPELEPGQIEELPELAVPLHTSDFRLPDPERDAFLALPASMHGFSDTNRALAGSARYRVLYHDAWRQPLTGANQAVPVWVSGGQVFGDRHELEGSLTFRFNPGQDRVVLDAKLWLSQFSSLPPAAGEEISLPDLPPQLTLGSASGITAAVAPEAGQTWYPVQVIPVINTREMRSNEFHYIDHPAVGIVVHVFPYTVPPLPVDADALL